MGGLDGQFLEYWQVLAFGVVDGIEVGAVFYLSLIATLCSLDEIVHCHGKFEPLLKRPWKRRWAQFSGMRHGEGGQDELLMCLCPSHGATSWTIVSGKKCIEGRWKSVVPTDLNLIMAQVGVLAAGETLYDPFEETAWLKVVAVGHERVS